MKTELLNAGFTPIGSVGGDWFRLETDKGRILAALHPDRVNLFFSASLVPEEDAYKITCHSPEMIQQILTVMM